MGRRFSVILTCFCLLACNNHMVRARICWFTCLKEIIRTLDIMKEQKVSCGEMSVTNVFASTKFTAPTSLVYLPQPSHCTPLNLEKDKFEVLCKAATVVRKVSHCHRNQSHLRTIFVDLKEIIQKAPCPVTADSTTKLKNFLEDLNDFSKRIMKEKSQ